VDVPDVAEVLDVRGKVIMPGLIDAHLHFSGLRTDHFISESLIVPAGVRLLRAARSARLVLEAGFTTVKDTGGPNALYLKSAIDEGSIPGPRILAAGYILTQTFGHGDDFMFLPIEWADARTSHGRTFALMCDGVEDCMKAARYSLREGADFIKVCTSGGVSSQKDKPEDVQFTSEEIRAIVRVARNAGTFVTTHCMSTEGMLMSIENGIKTIDHAWYPTDEVIEMGRRMGAIFVATLACFKKINEGGIEAGYPEWTVRKTKGTWNEVASNMRKLKDGGAIVAAGTDFIDTRLMRMGSNALELELLVEDAGFTPMEAIVSMTRNGAMACGMEDKIGTVQKGKLADLIVVDGDPLDNIRLLQNMENIRLVIKSGAIEVNRGL
jgi:imidazolonepropionase-like amidohydrolase